MRTPLYIVNLTRQTSLYFLLSSERVDFSLKVVPRPHAQPDITGAKGFSGIYSLVPLAVPLRNNSGENGSNLSEDCVWKRNRSRARSTK